MPFTCPSRTAPTLGSKFTLLGFGLSTFTLNSLEFFSQGTNGLTVQGHSSVRGNWDLNPGSVAKAEAQGEAVNSPGHTATAPELETAGSLPAQEKQ